MKVAGLIFAVFLVFCSSIDAAEYSFTTDPAKLQQSLNDTVRILENSNGGWGVSSAIEALTNLISGKVSSVLVAKEGQDIGSALEQFDKQTYLLVIPGKAPQRSADEPFISIGSSNGIQRLKPYIAAMQTLAGAMESFIPVPLHALKLEVLPVPTETIVLVYDISRGIFYLNEANLVPLDSVNNTTQLNSIYERFTVRVQNLLSVADKATLSDPLTLLSLFKVDLVSLLFDGIWFCIACIVVLAIGLPLAGNFLIADAVTAICEYYGGNPDDCAQYAIIAVVAGEILLPLYAYIIFVVCQLQTSCNNPGLRAGVKAVLGI